MIKVVCTGCDREAEIDRPADIPVEVAVIIQDACRSCQPGVEIAGTIWVGADDRKVTIPDATQ